MAAKQTVIVKTTSTKSRVRNSGSSGGGCKGNQNRCPSCGRYK